MADKESTLAALISALPKELRWILGGMLVFLAYFAMWYALSAMPAFFKNVTAPPPAKDLCWDLKEVQGKTYKFNRCTGEAIEMQIKAGSTPSSSQTVPGPSVPASAAQAPKAPQAPAKK